MQLVYPTDIGESFQFTDQEVQWFEKRYENNYDFVDDERYNHWKLIFHEGMLHNYRLIQS